MTRVLWFGLLWFGWAGSHDRNLWSSKNHTIPLTAAASNPRTLHPTTRCEQVKDGRLFINGVAQEEDFIAEGPEYTWGPSRVPDVGVFVVVG